MTNKTLRAALAALALCTAHGLHAQTATAATAAPAGPVLKMNQVTEEALVDALAIDEPVADDNAKTRSIRPSARNTSTPARATAGRSSLLITFATDSADLTAESKQALATVAKALQSDKLAGFAFSIEGHADPRGGAERNQKLSEARAQSVVQHLVTAYGILAERLAPVGKGSSELMNASRPDAPENRRVTIVTKRP